MLTEVGGKWSCAQVSQVIESFFMSDIFMQPHSLGPRLYFASYLLTPMPRTFQAFNNFLFIYFDSLLVFRYL